MNTNITKWKHIERTILPKNIRSKKVNNLKDDLVYTILQNLISFRNQGASYDETENALEFLKEIDIDKLLSHYIYLIIKKSPTKIESKKTIADLREKWTKK